MGGKVWGFQEQLTFGEAQQAALQGVYHRPTLVYAGREYDLLDDTAARIEVKTESRSLSASPNFFFERWRSLEPHKAGGPWQALQNAATQYVIWVPADGVYFVFEDIALLCRVTQMLAEKLVAKEHIIRNRGWSASGWALPRGGVLAACGKTVTAYRVVRGKGEMFHV
jgi:hypothetical protein